MIIDGIESFVYVVIFNLLLIICLSFFIIYKLYFSNKKEIINDKNFDVKGFSYLSGGKVTQVFPKGYDFIRISH